MKKLTQEQNKLILDLHSNLKEEYYNDIRDEIMKIWRERNQYYSSMQWNILRIEFSNLFLLKSYGDKL